ncbi:hypothetical protein VP01_769g3 [Puccinia sorghi]|uniref:Uncharacterized protein n=1 Tax=Puccinia sorghi TaxID=27349 RepID=A0A0L6UBJ9_9BASI|nr:hypothetical protein VP01_769g3 [Puccinia sorghi]
MHFVCDLSDKFTKKGGIGPNLMLWGVKSTSQISHEAKYISSNLEIDSSFFSFNYLFEIININGIMILFHQNYSHHTNKHSHTHVGLCVHPCLLSWVVCSLCFSTHFWGFNNHLHQQRCECPKYVRRRMYIIDWFILGPNLTWVFPWGVPPELQKKIAQLPAVYMQHAPAKLSSKIHLFVYVDVLAQSLKVGVTTEASWEFLHVNRRQLSKFFLQCLGAGDWYWIFSTRRPPRCFSIDREAQGYEKIVPTYEPDFIGIWLPHCMTCIRCDELERLFCHSLMHNSSSNAFGLRKYHCQYIIWRLLEKMWALGCALSVYKVKWDKAALYLKTGGKSRFHVGFFLLIQSGNWEILASDNTYKWGVFTSKKQLTTGEASQQVKCRRWCINSSNQVARTLEQIYCPQLIILSLYASNTHWILVKFGSDAILIIRCLFKFFHIPYADLPLIQLFQLKLGY